MGLIATKISTASADNFRLIKGKYVQSAGGAASTSDGDYIVCELPRKSYVTYLAVDIATAFTGSSTGTVTLGYKEPSASISASGFAADTVTLSEATGIKRVTNSMYFENGGIITLGITNGDSAAAVKVRAWVGYTVIS
jgi:hypothetical protein